MVEDRDATLDEEKKQRHRECSRLNSVGGMGIPGRSHMASDLNVLWRSPRWTLLALDGMLNELRWRRAPAKLRS